MPRVFRAASSGLLIALAWLLLPPTVSHARYIQFPSPPLNPTDRQECYDLYTRYDNQVMKPLRKELNNLAYGPYDRTGQKSQRVSQLSRLHSDALTAAGDARNQCLREVAAHENRVANQNRVATDEANRRRQEATRAEAEAVRRQLHGEAGRQAREAASREAQQAQNRSQQESRNLREGIDTLRQLRPGNDPKRESSQKSDAQRTYGAIHDSTQRMNDQHLRNSSIVSPDRGTEMRMRRETSELSMDAIKDSNLKTLGRLEKLGEDIQRFGADQPGGSSGVSRFEVAPPSANRASSPATGPSSQGGAAFEQRWSVGSPSADVSQPNVAPGGFASRWSASNSEQNPAPSSISRTSTPGSEPTAPVGRFEERWSGSSISAPSRDSQSSGRHDLQSSADQVANSNDTNRQACQLDEKCKKCERLNLERKAKGHTKLLGECRPGYESPVIKR